MIEVCAAGPQAGFAGGSVEAELTRPAFTPDGKTLFLAIQHPDGDEPKSSVVAITGF